MTIPKINKLDANAPNTKYFNPASVENVEFVFIVANIYKPKLCNSIPIYKYKKSFEETIKIKPNNVKIKTKKNSYSYKLFLAKYDKDNTQ